MALGGGTFTTQNKELPGAYINFISAAAASANLSERGVATMPLVLDWGPDHEVFLVTNGEFQKNSLKLFGYEYGSEKLKGLRDLFLHATKVYAYKLTSGGEKASNDFAVARHSGVRGNDLKVVIQEESGEEGLFKVQVYLGTTKVDEQTGKAASDLKDNDFVEWKTEAVLAPAASAPLTGGANGQVNGASHQSYLDKMESYSFHAMGADVTEEEIKGLYAAFAKRMRDQQGVKFQLVLYQKTADFEGVIDVKNPVKDSNWNESALVYWVTGITAGCAVNKSNQNKIYNGEFTMEAEYTQEELKKAIREGNFTFHKVGSNIRVLADINSFVTTSDTKGDMFKENQTIRVIDQMANDIAALFATKYLGVVPNDQAGRISLWSDIVKIHQELSAIRAIEDFKESDIRVEQGSTKKAVVVTDGITVVNAMSKLYMTTTIA